MSLEIIALSERNQTQRHKMEFCPKNYTISYIERKQVNSCAELWLESNARKEGGTSEGHKETIRASWTYILV